MSAPCTPTYAYRRTKEEATFSDSLRKLTYFTLVRLKMKFFNIHSNIPNGLKDGLEKMIH